MPTKKKPAARPSFLMRVGGLSRSTIAAFTVVFGLAGIYFVWHSLAGSGSDYPTAADQLVLQYGLPRQHYFSQTALTDFQPNAAMLYGNGLLLCGGQTQSTSQPYYLHSAQLSSGQVKSIVDQVNGAGFGNLKDNYQSDPNFIPADETGTSITLNLVRGTREITYYSGAKPAAFAKVEQIIKDHCSSVQSDYNPDGVVITSLRGVSNPGRPVKSAHGMVPNAGGSQTQELHGAAAQQAKAVFGSAKHVTLSQDGQVYDAMMQPVIPSFKVLQTANVKKDTAIAGSVMHLRWYWFYASDQSLSSYNTTLGTIRGSVHSFFTNQISGKSSTYGDSGVIRGNQTAAWYRSCHDSTCNANSDYYAYENVQNELKSRGYIGNNLSVNVLMQQGSAYGSAYCSGLGGSNGSIYGTTQGFGVTFGEQSGSACQGWAAEYQVPAHEEGHTFGAGHTCGETGSLMDNCNSTVYSWPSGYHVSTANDTLNQYEKQWFNSRSLAFNQEISGRVYYGSTGAGISGASIYTCNYGTITTNSSGYFYLRIPTNATLCLRVTGGVSGTPQGTGNNSEHANAPTYEYQVAGVNCYHNTSCSAGQQTWDRSSDGGFNFKY